MADEPDFDFARRYKELKELSRMVKQDSDILQVLVDAPLVDDPFITNGGLAIKINDPKPDFIKLMRDEITNLGVLVQKLDGFMVDQARHGTLEVIQQQSLRKAERRDHWWLWFQRLARWTGGVLVAVFLYSCLVWLQGHIDFIRLPVIDVLRDAFPGGK